MQQRTRRAGNLFAVVALFGIGCAHAPPPTSCGATIPRPSSAAVDALEVLEGTAAEPWIAELDRAIDAQDACRRAL